MPLPSGTRLGNYEILAPLGAGGMGEVYRARDTRLDRQVAVKILPPAFAADAERMARFEREAKVLASLNHPNVAAIYGIEQGAIIMELVEGDDLKGPLPVATAVDYARQIAAALEAAHERGIVHRDLKPANIKVRVDGTVKVLDFGLAKAATRDGAGATDPNLSPTLTLSATNAGVIMGTAAYMSPEQARGSAVDKRADIWAFGVVLLEMLTGRRTFGGETVSDTLAAVLRAEIDLGSVPRDTPPSIRRLLRRCLERDVKRRLPDIAVARMEIDDAATDAPPQAPVHRQSRLPWVATVIALAGCAVLAFMHFRETPPTAAPVRFTIDAPPGYSVRLFDSFALSPDSRRLAFGGYSGPAGSRIFLRSLDSPALQPVPESEGANFPFWSPDGRTLGFFVGHKLKRVDLSSGAVTAVDAAIGPGTWNREGVILFGAGAAGTIGRIGASGTSESPATWIDAAHGETYHEWPQFLPDGRHFLFLVSGRDNSGIYAGSLDSRERKLVTSFQSMLLSMAVYTDPGYLFLARNNQLTVAPFDARRLEFRGDPVVIAPTVASHPSGYAQFTASADVLVYRESEPVPPAQLTWFNRTGQKTGTAGAAGSFTGFRLSPDARHVAVTVDDGKEPSSIWILDAQRSTLTRFSSGAYSLEPVWSPDGTSLVYSSVRDTPPNLYRRALSSATEERLMTSPTQNYPTDWSRDGRTILYYNTDPKTLADLWTLPASGDRKPAPFLQTPYSEFLGRFSPEPGGPHWIAYGSDESGTYQVYVTAFPTPGRKWQISVDGGMHPAWRADGRELYYQDAKNRIMAVPINTASTFEAGAPHELFVNPGSHFDVTADGRRFLVAVPTGTTISPPITVVMNWRSILKR